jgi:hypothetical protein
MSKDKEPDAKVKYKSTVPEFFISFPSEDNPSVPLNMRDPRAENRALCWRDVAAPIPMAPIGCTYEERDAFMNEQDLQQAAYLETLKQEMPWVQREIDDIHMIIAVRGTETVAN